MLGQMPLDAILLHPQALKDLTSMFSIHFTWLLRVVSCEQQFPRVYFSTVAKLSFKRTDCFWWLQLEILFSRKEGEEKGLGET